jgi:hypothetical protein
MHTERDHLIKAVFPNLREKLENYLAEFGNTGCRNS